MLFEDPEAYPCLLARLDERPPKYVIYGYTWDVDDKHFRDYAAPIDRYIRSRYAIEFSTDGYEIWRRLDEAPPAAEAIRKPASRAGSGCAILPGSADAQVVLDALDAIGRLRDRDRLGLRFRRLHGAVQRHDVVVDVDVDVAVVRARCSSRPCTARRSST